MRQAESKKGILGKLVDMQLSASRMRREQSGKRVNAVDGGDFHQDNFSQLGDTSETAADEHGVVSFRLSRH